MDKMGENQYGFNELRHLMDDHYTGNVTVMPRQQQQQHYGMVLMDNGQVGHINNEMGMNSPSLPLHPLPPLENTTMTTTSTSIPTDHQQRMDTVYGGLFEDNGGGYSQGRWPRQETLTLLEIRSRLDSKFKESAHKAPLWDEISRIMAEEHGYQRSGKKCREKLENLYKYYKKTKEGRAGRQDGKHYRFFKQLDALYGSETRSFTTLTREETSNLRDYSIHHPAITTTSIPLVDVLEAPPPPIHPPLMENSSSELYTSTSSSDEDELCDGSSHKRSRRRRRRRRRGREKLDWKEKMKDFVDQQVKRLMDMQEALSEKMIQTLENKEKERISREEEWRKQESARLDLESKHRASERAWIEARNAVLMEALDKATNMVSNNIRSS